MRKKLSQPNLIGAVAELGNYEIVKIHHSYKHLPSPACSDLARHDNGHKQNPTDMVGGTNNC